MKLYSCTVKWLHKGSKYERAEVVRVKATSVSAAANRGIAMVKKANRKTWREPAGAVFRVTVLVIGGERKETIDGRRRLLQQEEEPGGGSPGNT